MSGERKPVTLPRLTEMKEAGEPIVMVTAYDFPSARVAEQAGVDIVLVGDTAAVTVLGYEGTEPVSMDELVMLGKAVRRGLKTPLMIGDMPMGSYEARNELAIASAQRLVKETGCNAVKLEGGGTSVDRARAIIRAGIPVMGHVGPDAPERERPRRLQDPGQDRRPRRRSWPRRRSRCSRSAASRSSSRRCRRRSPRRSFSRLDVPTIGIGAGPATAGQVLVFHDLLGITAGRLAKFVKPYEDIRGRMVAAVAAYAEEVRAGTFPGPEHVYSIDPSRSPSSTSTSTRRAWRPSRPGTGSRCPARGRRNVRAQRVDPPGVAADDEGDADPLTR